MKYDYTLTLQQNVMKLFNERNILNGKTENNKNANEVTDSKVDENQIETDELMLDHEERIILLEVGE